MNKRKGGGGSLNGSISDENVVHSDISDLKNSLNENHSEDHELMEHSTKIPDTSQTLPRNLHRKDRSRSSGRLFKAGTMANICERVEHAKDLVQHDTHYRIHCITVLLILLLASLLIFVSTKLLLLYLASSEPVCMTSQCLSSSARILSNFNSTLNPCDNFYNFACDGWKRKHELSFSDSEYSVENQIKDQLYDDLRRYLDQVHRSSSSNDSYVKAKRFYQSCMELDNIDVTSKNDFKHRIQDVGGWSIIGGWNGNSWERTSTLEKLHTMFGVEPFFKVQVGPDDLDPTLPFIIKIFPSGLGLPSREYYFNPKFEFVSFAIFSLLLYTIFLLLGCKSLQGFHVGNYKNIWRNNL